MSFFFTFGVRVCTHDRGGGPSYSPMVVFPPPPISPLPLPRPLPLPPPRSEPFQVVLPPSVVSVTSGAPVLRRSVCITQPLCEPGVVPGGAHGYPALKSPKNIEVFRASPLSFFGGMKALQII